MGGIGAISVWRAQMAAGGANEAILYYDEKCEWEIVTSGKKYIGREQVKQFMSSGLSASLERDEPEELAAFESGGWGAYEYISRGSIAPSAASFSDNVETSLIAKLRDKALSLLFKGMRYEIRVLFAFHVNDEGLIDKVREYVGKRGIGR